MTVESDKLKLENATLRRLLSQAGIDAAASEVTDRLQKLLIAELHHRVKNLLAMVLAITGQTLKNATDINAANIAIQNRITLLARSFDLLLDGGADELPLPAIIEKAIEPYNLAKQIVVTAAEVSVASLPALSIALVVNELCTNAIKYGSLSHSEGKVTLDATEDMQSVKMVWQESGGPTVSTPKKVSFGTTMMRGLIPQAVVDFDFKPTGLICQLDIPRSSLGVA